MKPCQKPHFFIHSFLPPSFRIGQGSKGAVTMDIKYVLEVIDAEDMPSRLKFVDWSTCESVIHTLVRAGFTCLLKRGGALEEVDGKR
jgi:hypothetical protein